MIDRAEQELAEVERSAGEAWDAVPYFYRTTLTSPCSCTEHRGLTFSDPLPARAA
ncbi:MAG: hypothetical protein JWM93_3976 [Frankiales bacterium]|nr:hypothetical protein [Frankiales bacterium]